MLKDAGTKIEDLSVGLLDIDDIIVYSRTFEEHLLHFQSVFERLRAAG